MGKYESDVKRLLQYVGGKPNIKAVSHCITRMRFVLANPGRADISLIEALPSVKGTFTQAGQFQVIIGNDVAEFYNEFTDVAGIEGVSKEAVKDAAKSNQNILQRVMGVLGEIFAPIIPALVCGGLILGLRNVIGEIRFFNDGTQSLADISQSWGGMYQFLWLIGEAVFHLLPVGIVWSITKKMGTTQILGIVLGLTLVSPQLLNGFSVASTKAADIPFWDFGFAHVRMIGYQGQVIAAMMAGFVLVYLERLFRRICPEVISMIVVPFCSLLLAVLISHTIVGPIGWRLGDGIAHIVYSGLTSPYRLFFAAIFGLLYAPLVMTGLHHMTNAIDSQLIAATGSTILWPMIALSNIAQGSSVVAMSVLQKRNKRAQQVNVPAFISCYLGVTEPALFGVNLKYVFPLVCGMLGSSCAAMISVGFGAEALSIGVGGIPGILSIRPRFFLVFLVAMLVAMIVPFLLTLIVGKAKLTTSERGFVSAEVEGADAADSAARGAGDDGDAVSAVSAGAAEPVDDGKATAIVDGKVIPLDQVPDEVFSKKVVGDGVAFEPTGNVVVAPADATVSVIMADTRHACGLKLANGVELLIHVGVDTVSMGGDGFECLAGLGDRVRRGDPLIRFDAGKIRKAGHPCTTMLIVTSEGDATGIAMHTGIDAKAGSTPVITWNSQS